MVEAYPLYWPDGWKRTHEHNRRRNHQFKSGFAVSRDSLMEKLRKLGASSVVLSTNIPLRRDGLPYADAREPQDPGVAVYFSYKRCGSDGRWTTSQMCFACDQYTLVRENIRAIALTIEALRGIERWGASDMMERAFQGFKALPEQSGQSWRVLLDFTAGEAVNLDQVEESFRRLVQIHHPDKGGDVERFRSIVSARENARRELMGALNS